MGFPIEPGNLVSQGYSNFPKTAWMTSVHLPRFRIIHIHTVLVGFAYPWKTMYADFVWVYRTPHLKSILGKINETVQYVSIMFNVNSRWWPL